MKKKQLMSIIMLNEEQIKLSLLTVEELERLKGGKEPDSCSDSCKSTDNRTRSNLSCIRNDQSACDVSFMN